MSFQVIIDRSVCNGYGACADIDPADFAIGADGIAVASHAAGDAEAAREAQRQCPMGAITVLDEVGVEVR
jgi:ferredoxin